MNIMTMKKMMMDEQKVKAKKQEDLAIYDETLVTEEN